MNKFEMVFLMLFLHMLFQHSSVTVIKSLKIFSTAFVKIVVQSAGWQLLDGRTMVEHTPQSST